ncbi:hypothetical protein [Microbacterium rhizomatis]|nr:hypothetical protein [Microbacterium rhizomatis]
MRDENGRFRTSRRDWRTWVIGILVGVGIRIGIGLLTAASGAASRSA